MYHGFINNKHINNDLGLTAPGSELGKESSTHSPPPRAPLSLHKEPLPQTDQTRLYPRTQVALSLVRCSR